MAYGATPAYGSVSVLDPAMVTSHRINLAGLAPSTIYHYKVVSRDAQGRMAESGDFTFTTSATTGSQILLQLHSDASEVSGVTNGSIVTPAIAPARIYRKCRRHPWRFRELRSRADGKRSLFHAMLREFGQCLLQI